MTNVKPGVDRGIDLTLPNCLLYCYRSHSNASHLPCQQTFPSPLRLYSVTIQCQTPRLLWSKIYCLIILHISKTALKPLYWPLPTGCRCRKTKIEWNDWRTEKTSSRTDSSKCPVMREVLNSWDSLWFQLVLSNNVQLKKMVESYWGTWDAQPAPVPVQGRIERTICPVDPQLSSEDLTSRNILSQMPFPVSKRSEGRAVLYSLGIDLQLCGAADKIWRGMEPPQHWEITLKQEQQQGHHRTWLGYQTAW